MINLENQTSKTCNACVQFYWIQKKIFKDIWYFIELLKKDISVSPTTNSESFRYKTSITGKTAHIENTKEVEFSIPLKHLSNFCRTLNMPLSKCEVSLTLYFV